MKVVVVGGTGATGRLLLKQLLDRGAHVKAFVRAVDRVPAELREDPNLELIVANVLDLDDATLERQVEEVDAIASCLGHTLSFRGLFGPPRRLVRDSMARLAETVRKNSQGRAVKFVLMNTAGNHNPETDKPISLPQRIVLGLLRFLVPPHADNEEAADFLLHTIGTHDPAIEWVVVRPDGLFDEEEAADVVIEPSPTRSAIFDSGKTSRIQVAHFMAELITDPETWDTWKGTMPVIYHHDFS